MWLLRWHLIETRDYNKIERIVSRAGYGHKNYSSMLLVKWILLHTLQNKSWRLVAWELRTSHVPLYQFSVHMKWTTEFRDIISYLISRRIVLYVSHERHITTDILSGETILLSSQKELERIFMVNV